MFNKSKAEILAYLKDFDVKKYESSRNYLDGNVSQISPYLTHGVISLKDVYDTVLEHNSFEKAEKFIFELAWREYFRRIWENLGDGIFENIKQPQQNVQNYGLPKSVLDSKTTIKALDEQLDLLKKVGYMHNHARMWLAGTVCNIAHYDWKEPAKWLYYHLLDGDPASNFISWQWNCGTSRKKIYFANQENINKYSRTYQKGTFLDKSYEELAICTTPVEMQESVKLNLTTNLELFKNSALAKLQRLENKNIAIFHPWMLDSQLDFGTDFEGQEYQKILIIEPSHFQKLPISEKRVRFILDFASKIENLYIFVGEISEFKQFFEYSSAVTIFHPAISHWQNSFKNLKIKQSLYIFSEVTKFYPSFFAYWKACNKVLQKRVKGGKWH
jgi:deoxyribodipyrimidine photo-lyase